MGETTVAIAQAHPEADFIAVEVHGPGVGSLLNRIEQAEAVEPRVIRHDAVEVLERMIADGEPRRDPPLLPRPVAEEAPPQAPPGAAGVRGARGAQARRRRLAARGDRLAGLRGAHGGGVFA